MTLVELDVSDITSFRPRQKAAAVLVALGPSAASAVLAHLTEEEVELLALEISRMGPIPGNVQGEILEEFYEDALANRYVNEGGVEYAKELLANWKGTKGEEIITRLMHLDTLKDDELDARLEGREELGEPQAAGIHPGVTPTRPA